MPSGGVAEAVHGSGVSRSARRLVCRNASTRDIVEFYGKLPRETMYAMVATLDDVPVGIMGIARDGWAYRLFSESKPALEPYLRSVTLLRGVKAALRLLDDREVPVYAVAQDDEGERLLKLFGFVKDEIQGDTFWRF
jgi:hypothetical protein